jgi:hypothetical protein
MKIGPGRTPALPWQNNPSLLYVSPGNDNGAILYSHFNNPEPTFTLEEVYHAIQSPRDFRDHQNG